MCFCTACVGHALNCGCLHCQTHASSASVNHPALNILVPEFVPRGQRVATQHQADTSSGRLIFGSGNVLPVSTLNSSIGRRLSSQHAADKFVYSAGGNVMCNEYLPEHFADVAIGQREQSPAQSSSTRHRRDASTQTAKVHVVDACIGNSSVLLVDASTSTAHYDEAVGMQRALGSSQNDNSSIRNAGSPLEMVGIGLQNRSSASTTPSDRWADCWQTPAGSVNSENKSSFGFSHSSKNHTLPASATDFTASASACCKSSGLHVEEVRDTGTKSSLFSMHQPDGACECSSANCPFASSTQSSSTQRNVVRDQTMDASSGLSGNQHGHETMQVKA